MTLYYQDDYTTLYHGDCRKIEIPHSNIDAVLTDPPYGINVNTKRGRNRGNNPEIYNDNINFDPTWLLGYPHGIMRGGNYFHPDLPLSHKWLIWDNGEGDASNVQADCELAYTWGLQDKQPRLFSHQWNGWRRKSERGIFGLHPTQKPIALMLWCLSFLPDAETIFDPYCDSGPVLIAAKQLNKKCIGIEIEERYCEIAAQRLSQEVLDFGDVS